MTIIKNLILTTTVAVIFGVLAIGDAAASSYYVAPNGSDANPGTEAKPFETIQKAADIVNPGDVVKVKNGVYTDTDNSNFIVNLNRGGTSDNWITFRSENKWGAIIDGEENKTSFCWNFGTNAHYIRIEGFEVTGCSGGGFWSNARSSHIYFYQNYIHHIGRRERPCPNGEYVQGGLAGIYAGSDTSYHTYDSNLFQTNGRIPSGCNKFDFNHDHGIYSRSISNTLIFNNVFVDHEAGWHVAFGNPNKGMISYHDVTIANNTFIGTNPGRTGNAILINDSPAGRPVPINNIYIKNNIIYGANNCAMKIVSEAEEVYVINNLIYPSITLNCVDGYPVGTFEIDFEENNIIGKDPQFIHADIFDLLPDSPAIDAGIALEEIDYDIEGVPRPQGNGWDIGAYEFGGNVIPPDATPQCSDGKDNDADDLIDLHDPGCFDANDDNEFNTPPPTKDSINSPKTLTPITMDGMLPEDVWARTESVTFSNPSRSDNLVKVSTQWDDDYLYFAYEVTDSHLEAENQKLWQDDGAEIFLDTGNNKTTSMDSNDYHFMININDMSNPTGINTRTATTADGYTMEIAIPWNRINTTPAQGKTMGLLLANNDRDNGASVQFDWLDLIETGSYARPHLWRELVLMGQPDGPPPGDCQGDLNEDGQIDVADLQRMVNIILGATGENACTDIDGSGVVDIVDLQVLVNAILGS